jgi:hypothetical protein
MINCTCFGSWMLGGDLDFKFQAAYLAVKKEKVYLCGRLQKH